MNIKRFIIQCANFAMLYLNYNFEIHIDIMHIIIVILKWINLITRSLKLMKNRCSKYS